MLPRFGLAPVPFFAMIASVALVALTLPSSLASAAEADWEVVVINADSNYEAAGAADFNNDGHIDIMAGDTYYAGPDWKPHPVRPIDERDGYRLDFANVPMDVNGDGWIDVVSCNWHERSVVWRQNPGDHPGDKPGGRIEWKEHLVDRPGNMETAIAVDVDGDGAIDFLPDVAQKTIWYRLEKGKLVGHELSSEIGGHGVGFGDVNGDGRGDILKPTGWFEAPADRIAGTWNWHPEWNLGQAGIEIVVHDFDGDGLNDIYWGMGHDYGRSWLRQGRDSGGQRTWTASEIDRDWSQAHAVVLVDIDGDGMKDILTGKRYYAHNGNDPGGKDALGLYVYRFDRVAGAFKREVIHEGGRIGLGLAPVVIDIDGDGDLDLIAPGKSGLYLLLRR